MASSDVLVDYCKNKGFYVEPLRNFDGSEDDRTVVIEFPCAFPEGTILAEQMSAIDQMDLVRGLQRVWADNAISVTVYYKAEELEEIQEYLAQYWHEMKSVSFLLHSEHGFDQAPMGELSLQEYKDMLEATTPLGEKLSGSTFMTDEEFEAECATGACPIR
jgi:hypothetical protein